MNPILMLLLQDKNDYLSGENIGKKLNISRAAVWKHIEKIRAIGFKIDSTAGKGYKISKFPKDRIIPEQIKLIFEQNANTKFPYDIMYKPKMSSTNTFAKKQIVNDNHNDFVVITDCQTSGRGRLKRSWQSSIGTDLTFSLVLHPNKPISEFYKYTMLTSVAIHTALKQVLPNTKIGIKWPNDIYINNNNNISKICGILSEMITEQNIIENIIIGIGININSTPTLPNAVSLKQLTDTTYNTNELLANILMEITQNLGLFGNGKFSQIYDYWYGNLIKIGEPITIDTGRAIYKGILKSVNQDGAVILEINGEEKVLYSGDILID